MPWDQRPSICDHIRAHVDEANPGLIEGGETLPDDARIAADSRIRWAAGAMDGVMGHHMGQGENEEFVRKAVYLVMAYCQSPTAKTKAAFYLHVIEGNTLPLIDPIIEALIGEEGLNHERLYELAYSFVTEAPDREPVKFGIAFSASTRTQKTHPSSKHSVGTKNSHCLLLLHWGVTAMTLSNPSGRWQRMSMAGAASTSSSDSPTPKAPRSRTGCSEKGIATP